MNPKSSLNENQFRVFDSDELKTQTPTFRSTNQPKNQTLSQLLEKFEHFSTCVKILAFILRFVKNAKLKPSRQTNDLFFTGENGLISGANFLNNQISRNIKGKIFVLSAGGIEN